MFPVGFRSSVHLTAGCGDALVTRRSLPAWSGASMWVAIPSPPVDWEVETYLSGSDGMRLGVAGARMTKRSFVFGSRHWSLVKVVPTQVGKCLAGAVPRSRSIPLHS